MADDTPALRHAQPATLALPLAYEILRLRVDVFVVEQRCAYPELDGRDLEPDTVWAWATASNAGPVSATLRILAEPDGAARIGRVATRPDHRSSGVASGLVGYALEVIGPGRPVVLDAQSHLQAWYERFGFLRSGPVFVEDGIEHVPMVRARPGA